MLCTKSTMKLALTLHSAKYFLASKTTPNPWQGLSFKFACRYFMGVTINLWQTKTALSLEEISEPLQPRKAAKDLQLQLQWKRSFFLKVRKAKTHTDRNVHMMTILNLNETSRILYGLFRQLNCSKLEKRALNWSYKTGMISSVESKEIQQLNMADSLHENNDFSAK